MRSFFSLVCLAVFLAGCAKPMPEDGTAASKFEKKITPKDEPASVLDDLKKAGAEMVQEGPDVVSITFKAGSKVTDRELALIGQLPKLRILNLAFCSDITDAGMMPLSNLNDLQTLILTDTPIGDPGLRPLAGLTNLRELELNQTKITDAGLARLIDLKNLEELEVQQTAVGDAGLKELKGLSKLKVLKVKLTKVTEAGAKELKAAIPGLEVTEK